MRLADLNPKFLTSIARDTFDETDDITKAEALTIICPECYKWQRTTEGVHRVTYWQPQSQQWKFEATSYDDLTIAAPRRGATVALHTRCGGFVVTNGTVRLL
jgi:hypothetical protein